jgi:sortase (surface protein transpeptidase)
METQYAGSSSFEFRDRLRLIALTLFVLLTAATALPLAALHSSAAPLSPNGDETQEPLLPNQWMGVFDERLLLDYVKGVKPAGIKIDAINVNANIEMLEILNGEMQPPTNENDVGWYKESGRLGVPGNVMFAGHVNWYNTPVAVFGHIGELQKGDKIEVTGTDGETFFYQVKWVKNFPAFEEPPKQVVGGTSKKVLTLITCGGEWDPTVGLYNERTVVRAEIVDDLQDHTQDDDQDDDQDADSDESKDDFQDIQPVDDGQ